MPVAEGNVALKRFHWQQTSSAVHSTPIERSWGDVNDVTRKYRDEFHAL